MTRNLLIAGGVAALIAFASARLVAADGDALVLPGTAGTILAQDTNTTPGAPLASAAL